MFRHSWKAALLAVALSCLVQDAQASGRKSSGPYRRKPVAEYLVGGYGPGPFGKGDFVYAGYSSYNYQAQTRVRHR